MYPPGGPRSKALLRGDGEEVTANMKKLILRTLYSATTLALVVFVLGAAAKHPKGGK
jgi:hypothetical protein